MALLDAPTPIETDGHVLRARRTAACTRIATALAGSAVLVLPGSFKKIGNEGSMADLDEFAEWRKTIATTELVALLKSAARPVLIDVLDEKENHMTLPTAWWWRADCLSMPCR